MAAVAVRPFGDLRCEAGSTVTKQGLRLPRSVQNKSGRPTEPKPVAQFDIEFSAKLQSGVSPGSVSLLALGSSRSVLAIYLWTNVR